MTLFLLLTALLAVPPDTEPRTVTAAPVDGPLSIDGRLDEAAWDAAGVATDFVQFEPDEGAPASFSTEVRVLYGATTLYVGAVMHDPEPEQIRRPLSRRDDDGGAALFVVGIDGYLDQKSAYLFAVTAAGVQLDAVQTGDDSDTSWDAVWDSAVRVTPEGWVAELAIPYSMLRFSPAEEQTWGVQFQRTIPRRSEEDFWQPVTREEQGTGFIAGRLTGLRGIAPRRTFQLRPYTLSRARTFEDAQRLGTADASFGADVGADLKVGLASNLILDATINPDFGQVDADPAQLNLSTFETFFEERRPFFLEGTAIFDYTIDSGRDGRLLYTRRIGAADPIIGAAKLTGRTSGGLSVGGLAALTGDAFSPARLFGTARAKQEFGARSFVGAGLTYVDEVGSERTFSGARALVGGGDWDVRVGGGTYRWDGAATGSYRTPTASASTAPSETGFALYTGLDKIRGNTTWGTGLRVYSDTFRPNDLGRLRQNDYVRVGGGGSTYLNSGKPLGPFRRVRLNLFGDQTWSYAGLVNRGFSSSASANWDLKNFSAFGLNVGVEGLGGFDVRETRGLGLIRNRRSASVDASYETDSRRRLRLEPEAGLSFQERGGLGWRAEMEVEWNASDRLDFSLDAEYASDDGRVAWAANESFRRTQSGLAIGETDGPPADVSGFVPFGDPALRASFDDLPVYNGVVGEYYLPVFGARDTRALDLALRTSVTFRPNLSLQLYSQLFAARGRYRDFQLLAAPDDLRPFDAYPKRRAFSVESLLSNAVLRWEYRPGSTVFVVWSHTRFGEDDAVRFFDDDTASPFATPTFTQLGDAFRIYPENVFLIKLSYLIMR